MPDANLHGTSSCIEFAVVNLEVKNIVIMGHASCGGVRAFVDAETDPKRALPRPDDFIGPWMSLIKPAADKIGTAAGVSRHYAERLARPPSFTRSPTCAPSLMFVNARPAANSCFTGLIFGIADGRLLALDKEQGVFLPIGEAAHAKAFAAPRF